MSVLSELSLGEYVAPQVFGFIVMTVVKNGT